MAKIKQLYDENDQPIYPAVAKEQILDLFYPVGSIYMTTTISTAAEVSTRFGGTWERWGAGQVPVGVDINQTEFSTVEKTGGEKEHKLVESEIPSFSFGVGHIDGADSKFVGISGVTHVINTNASGQYMANGSQGTNSKWRHDYSFGGGESHNNLQPYITAYFYKRIA